VARRHDPDPLLLQTVSARLARLLAESAPGPPAPPDPSGAPGPADPAAGGADLSSSARRARVDRGSEAVLESVDELPAPPRFRRVHVGVVAVLLLAGLLWSGWSVLRARPVALADPGVVSVSASPASAATPATAATPPAPARASPSPAPTGAGGSAAARVVVHVLGAVRRPGLVTLPVPARVQDAVDAAGGFARTADAGELNLAQLLEDGQQVVIGTGQDPEGEVRGRSGGTSGGGGSSGDSSASASGGSREQVLDLNQADQGELEELPGVGPVTAAAIVAWREEHGRFSRTEELQEVDGIGPKTYAQIAPRVRV
jgi:competence protein ComEA